MDPNIDQILSQLPIGEREKIQDYITDLKDSAKKAAIAGVLARNFSHGVGTNIRKLCKDN